MPYGFKHYDKLNGYQETSDIIYLEETEGQFKIQRRSRFRLHPGISSNGDTRGSSTSRSQVLQFHGWERGSPIIENNLSEEEEEQNNSVLNCIKMECSSSSRDSSSTPTFIETMLPSDEDAISNGISNGIIKKTTKKTSRKPVKNSSELATKKLPENFNKNVTGSEAVPDKVADVSLENAIEENDAMTSFNSSMAETPSKSNLNSTHSVLESTLESEVPGSSGATHESNLDDSLSVRRKKAIYRRAESVIQLEQRRARMRLAIKKRKAQLDQLKRTSSKSDNDGKENFLTRTTLLLAGDRHGTFEGRPSMVTPSVELYPPEYANIYVNQRTYLKPDQIDLSFVPENAPKYPPTKIQISVLDVVPAVWSNDFKNVEVIKKRITKRSNTGEMSHAEVARRTEAALKRKDERQAEKEERKSKLAQARLARKQQISSPTTSARPVPSKSSVSSTPRRRGRPPKNPQKRPPEEPPEDVSLSPFFVSDTPTVRLPKSASKTTRSPKKLFVTVDIETSGPLPDEPLVTKTSSSATKPEILPSLEDEAPTKSDKCNRTVKHSKLSARKLGKGSHSKVCDPVKEFQTPRSQNRKKNPSASTSEKLWRKVVEKSRKKTDQTQEKKSSGGNVNPGVLLAIDYSAQVFAAVEEEFRAQIKSSPQRRAKIKTFLHTKLEKSEPTYENQLVENITLQSMRDPALWNSLVPFGSYASKSIRKLSRNGLSNHLAPQKTRSLSKAHILTKNHCEYAVRTLSNQMSDLTMLKSRLKSIPDRSRPRSKRKRSHLKKSDERIWTLPEVDEAKETETSFIPSFNKVRFGEKPKNVGLYRNEQFLTSDNQANRNQNVTPPKNLRKLSKDYSPKKTEFNGNIPDRAGQSEDERNGRTLSISHSDIMDPKTIECAGLRTRNKTVRL